MLLTGGTPAAYVDLARHAAQHGGLPDAEGPTVIAGAVRDAGQRVDRQYGSGGLVGALHSLVLEQPDRTSHISPHRPIVARFYPEQLVRLLSEGA